MPVLASKWRYLSFWTSVKFTGFLESWAFLRTLTFFQTTSNCVGPRSSSNIVSGQKSIKWEQLFYLPAVKLKPKCSGRVQGLAKFVYLQPFYNLPTELNGVKSASTMDVCMYICLFSTKCTPQPLKTFRRTWLCINHNCWKDSYIIMTIVDKVHSSVIFHPSHDCIATNGST